MEKKYILTDETINKNGHVLHRIKAVKTFFYVKAGDLGGFVENEWNLSHEGICWVYDEAQVFGEARVFDAARVYDEAQVFGEARVFGEAQVSGGTKVYDEALVFGEAQVYDEAQVFGEARIYGEAQVFGEAHVYGTADICVNAYVHSVYDHLTVSNLGSRDSTTTFFKTKENGIYVTCGCFRGTIDQFSKAVEETHRNNQHAIAYKAAIEMAKTILKKRGVGLP